MPPEYFIGSPLCVVIRPYVPEVTRMDISVETLARLWGRITVCFALYKSYPAASAVPLVGTLAF